MTADNLEVLDLVERKGPISHAAIMRQESVYSSDEVYTALVELQEEGKVERYEGNMADHGTTRDVWEATT